MFEDFMGHIRLDKKWARLINCVKSDDEESKMFSVNVSKKHIFATDGSQIIRVEKDEPATLDEGYYMLCDRVFVPVPDEFANFQFPNLEKIMNRNQFTKTAVLEFDEFPLLAMCQTLKEFSVAIDIDNLRRVLEMLSEFKPVYVRIYGYSDPAVAKESAIKLELLVEKNCEAPVVVEYCVMPLKVDDNKFVKVDKQPMLFDLKKSA